MNTKETTSMSLSALCRRVESSTDIALHGPAGWVAALAGGCQTPPAEWLGVPVWLEAAIPGADSVRYPLIAGWMTAESAGLGDFAPLLEWQEELAESDPRAPLLVLSRAEGHWQLPAAEEPEWTELLGERDPLGRPDGRMLLRAASAGKSCAEALLEAAEDYLGTMQPRCMTPLPPATMLLRSGPGKLILEAPRRGDCYISFFRFGGKVSGEALQRHRATLPAGYRAQWEAEGNLLWGSWRAGGDAVRFAATTQRADKALRTRLAIGGEPACEEMRRFAEELFGGHPSSRPDLRAQVLGVGAAPSTSYLRSLSVRLREGMERALHGDVDVARALRRGRCVVLREAWRQLPSLYEAAQLPAGSQPPTDGGGPGDARAREEALPPSDLLAFLGRPKDIRVVLPPAMAGAVGLPNPEDRVAMETSGAELTLHWEAAQSNGRGETEFQVMRLLNAAAGGDLEDAGDAGMQASIDLLRPARYLRDGLAALTDWLDRHALGASLQRLREDLEELASESPQVRLRMEFELPSIALSRLRSVPGNEEPGRERAHRGAAAVQRMLRAHLPLLLRKSAEDLVDVAPNRAFMVYAHSHAYASARKTEILPDPLLEKNVCRTAYSAGPSLRRRFPSWSRLTRAEGVTPWARESLQFAEDSIERALLQRSVLLRLLVEEYKLCNSLAKLAVAMKQQARCALDGAGAQGSGTAATARDLARQIHQPLSRMCPGGVAAALAPLALLEFIAGLTHAEHLIRVSVLLSADTMESDKLPQRRLYRSGAAGAMHTSAM